MFGKQSAHRRTQQVRGRRLARCRRFWSGRRWRGHRGRSGTRGCQRICHYARGRPCPRSSRSFRNSDSHGASGADLNAPQQLTRIDIVLFALEDLVENAGAGSGDLNGDFVGLQLDQRLVQHHALADRLQPAQQLGARAFGLLGGGADFENPE